MKEISKINDVGYNVFTIVSPINWKFRHQDDWNLINNIVVGKHHYTHTHYAHACIRTHVGPHHSAEFRWRSVCCVFLVYTRNIIWVLCVLIFIPVLWSLFENCIQSQWEVIMFLVRSLACLRDTILTILGKLNINDAVQSM